MREVKRASPWFSITEYEKEAAYLRRRHKILHKVRHYITCPNHQGCPSDIPLDQQFPDA